MLLQGFFASRSWGGWFKVARYIQSTSLSNQAKVHIQCPAIQVDFYALSLTGELPSDLRNALLPQTVNTLFSLSSLQYKTLCHLLSPVDQADLHSALVEDGAKATRIVAELSRQKFKLSESWPYAF